MNDDQIHDFFREGYEEFQRQRILYDANEIAIGGRFAEPMHKGFDGVMEKLFIEGVSGSPNLLLEELLALPSLVALWVVNVSDSLLACEMLSGNSGVNPDAHNVAVAKVMARLEEWAESAEEETP